MSNWGWTLILWGICGGPSMPLAHDEFRGFTKSPRTHFGFLCWEHGKVYWSVWAKCHRNEKRISWVTGCAHGQKFERGHLVFSLYGPKKTLEDACEASGHSRGSAASCLEAWVQSWWGLGCPRMLKFNFFLALPLNSQIVISLTLNHVLKGPFGLLLTPPWAGIPRSQVLPGRISRFNRDVLLSYCHQKWNHINRRFLLSQVLFG